MSPESPAIAVLPFEEEGIARAVKEAGGRIVEPSQAAGIVWLDPRDPDQLRNILSASPTKWVQLPMAGIESFVEAGLVTSERVWTCTKGIYGPACAEHALALMLAAARRLQHHLRERTWNAALFGSGHRRLKGSTVLVVGTGGIGSSLITLLQPFDVRIWAVNRSGAPASGAERTESSDSLRELLHEADFVVLALAVTNETRKLFDADMIAAMGKDSWLVNVARGVVVDTEALVEALRAEKIGGAALDVTDPEPLPDGHPLWEMDNVIITPHIANTVDMALPELRALVARNVKHVAAGEPLEGLVDPDLGY